MQERWDDLRAVVEEAQDISRSSSGRTQKNANWVVNQAVSAIERGTQAPGAFVPPPSSSDDTRAAQSQTSLTQEASPGYAGGGTTFTTRSADGASSSGGLATLIAFVSALVSIGAGIYLLSAKSVVTFGGGTISWFQILAHGIGIYFIAKGLYMGASLYQQVEQNKLLRSRN